MTHNTATWTPATAPPDTAPPRPDGERVSRRVLYYHAQRDRAAPAWWLDAIPPTHRDGPEPATWCSEDGSFDPQRRDVWTELPGSTHAGRATQPDALAVLLAAIEPQTDERGHDEDSDVRLHRIEAVAAAVRAAQGMGEER